MKSEKNENPITELRALLLINFVLTISLYVHHNYYSIDAHADLLSHEHSEYANRENLQEVSDAVLEYLSNDVAPRNHIHPQYAIQDFNIFPRYAEEDHTHWYEFHNHDREYAKKRHEHY